MLVSNIFLIFPLIELVSMACFCDLKEYNEFFIIVNTVNTNKKDDDVSYICLQEKINKSEEKITKFTT